METAQVLNVIRKVVAAQLDIRTDVAYPSQLRAGDKRGVEGATMFDALLPGILDRLAGKIHDDLFGSLAGSPRMQAVRLQKFMEKHYVPLQPILGEQRFRKSIDFPAKVDAWKERQLQDEEIQEFLVKGAAKMYWSAAQRDPRILEREIASIIGAAFKKRDVGMIVIEERLPALLQRLDLRRASAAIKDLFHDLHVYAGVLYLVDKIMAGTPPNKGGLGTPQQSPINVLRNCVAQIAQAFVDHPEIQKTLA